MGLTVEWLSSSRDLHLDLGLGHTAHRHASVIDLGPLTAEIGSGVWDTPKNFNGFCVLGALLHGI